jgi:membrane-associated phospholipid phosphatase
VVAWHDALARPTWLTDAASLAYVGFFAIPALMAWQLLRTRPAALDSFVFAIQAAFFVPYVGYFAFPATGPRVPVALEDAVLGGNLVSVAVRAFLRTFELNVLDAFPSGHASVSIVFLVLGWRLFPRWRAPLVLAVGAILFATVYLSFHYVVDLVAGAMVAVLLLAALPWLGRLWGCDASPLRASWPPPPTSGAQAPFPTPSEVSP